MNKKIIFVNATSATVGGSLTILNKFVENIIIMADVSKKYYVFVPENCKIQSNNYYNIVKIKAKKTLDRLKWDLLGIKKWAKKNNIVPDLIISLQNTGVLFNKVKQIVYLHQPLPYAKESKWSFFKSDERKLWIYRNIYKWWIDFTVKRNSDIIVQTEWMREALINRGYKEEKILIAKPNVNSIEIENIIPLESKEQYFFYPAANYKYKNHEVIIKAVNDLIKENNTKFKIIFTLDEKSNIYKKVIDYGIKDYFDFVGIIPYEKVLSYYKSCAALIFPSYIETFGLPLIECSSFGKKILVSDCNYAREVLNNYKLASFVPYNDVIAWKDQLKNLFSHYKEEPKKVEIRNEWEDVFNLIDKAVNSKHIG